MIPFMKHAYRDIQVMFWLKIQPIIIISNITSQFVSNYYILDYYYKFIVDGNLAKFVSPEFFEQEKQYYSNLYDPVDFSGVIGDEVKLVSENESVYVPLGAVHRMENPGKLDMVLIEVQTGAYLGEDDIIRYEDVYARRARPGS